MHTITIFLASSDALLADKEALELYLFRKNRFWEEERQISFQVIHCKNGETAMSLKNSQDEYNKAIQQCDFFVLLFENGIGQYSEEEFDIAVSQFKKIQKPLIYVYEKVLPMKTQHPVGGSFRLKFERDLKHYYQQYDEPVTLQGDLYNQLELLYSRRSEIFNRPLPRGFLRLEKSDRPPKTSEEVKYIDYLQDSNLPYISRDAFLKNNQSHTDFITESVIYERLLTNSSIEGGIIYGPGGVGKTRLMLEIGRMAMSQNWQVIQVLSDARAVEDLRPFLSPSKRYLLLFDYVEESSVFNSAIVSRLVGDKPVTVKVLANCRFSFIDSPNFPHESFYWKIELSEEKEKVYYDYVTDHILTQIKTKFAPKNRGFYNNKPSFAVFLKFLTYSKKILTDDIREVDDFKSWINKRLRVSLSTLHFDSADHDRLYLLGLLPVQDDKIDVLHSGSLKKYLIIFQNDGWIEQIAQGNNSVLRVIHDTVTDEVLITHFEKFRTDALFLQAIEAFLKLAITFSLTANWLRSLERIWNLQTTCRKEAVVGLFGRYISAAPQQVSDIKLALTVTPILTEEDRIHLFISHPDFFQSCIERQDFALSLSFAMNKAAKSEITDEYKAQLNSLFKKWYTYNGSFITIYNLSWRILSTYIKLFGTDDFIASKLQVYLKTFTLGRDTSYVLAAYLYDSGNPKPVRFYILLYLEKFIDQESVNFLLVAWLSTKSDDHALKEYVLHYLDKFSGNIQARHVLLAWLENLKERKAIEVHLQNFLDNHSEKAESGALIRKLLHVNYGKKNAANNEKKSDEETAAGESVTVQSKEHYDETLDLAPYLLRYLDNNAENSAAGFIVQKWLDDERDPASIENHIVRYLAANTDGAKAKQVMQKWLDKKGNADVVKPYLLCYLDKNAEAVDTSFVIQSWFSNKGDLLPVELYIQRYLEKNAEALEANSVIQKWIDKKGNPQTIQPYLLRYLNQNAENEGGRYILLKWFQVHSEINAVAPYMVRYVLKNPESEWNTFFLKRLFYYGITSGITSSFICIYLDVYVKKTEASYIMQKWLELNPQDASLIQPYLVRFIKQHCEQKETNFLLQKWLDIYGEADTINVYVIYHLRANSENKASGFLMRKWLSCGGKFSLIRVYITDYLRRNARDLDASILIQMWLDETHDTESVERIVLDHLEENAELPIASYVLQKWIDYGGSTDTILPYLIQHFEVNSEHVRAGYLLKKCLPKKQNIPRIKTYLLRFLKNNANNFLTPYFLNRLQELED